MQSRRQRTLKGVVIIEAIIGVDGTVENARVIRSIPLLDQAALDIELVNRLQCGAKQQGRLIVISGPPTFAIDALPAHIELRVDQDDGFGTPASRAHDAVFIEHLAEDNTSVHTRGVGSRGP